MPVVRYSAAKVGTWMAMVDGARLLVVATPDADRVVRLRDAMGVNGSTQAVLDVLTTGGISTTPAFALVDLPAAWPSAAPVTAIVRGSLVVVVTASQGTVDIPASGISTWAERTVESATGITVDTGTAALKSPVGDRSLELSGGTALVSFVAAGVIDGWEAEPHAAAAEPQTAAAGPEPVAVEPAEAAPAIDPGVTLVEPTVSGSATSANYDDLFVETVQLRSSRPIQGDHDGMTVAGMDSDVRKAAREARAAAKSARVAGPKFAAVFSTGQVEPLDTGLIVGRAPAVEQASGDSVPRTVKVGGPEQDISRSHVQVGVQGDVVVVVDLNSRNGTVVHVPGHPPQQLRPGEPTSVLVGTVIDLGSGITMTVTAV